MINAQAELDKVRLRRSIARRKSYRSSRLAKHRAELVALRIAGASYPELACWLRKERRIKVAHTTVMRFLAKCPELLAGSDDRE